MAQLIENEGFALVWRRIRGMDTFGCDMRMYARESQGLHAVVKG